MSLEPGCIAAGTVHTQTLNKISSESRTKKGRIEAHENDRKHKFHFTLQAPEGCFKMTSSQDNELGSKLRVLHQVHLVRFPPIDLLRTTKQGARNHDSKRTWIHNCGS